MSREKRTPEEHFLRDATRGLPRRARAAAQAELRSHIHERAQQLQLLMGTTAEVQARERAMHELGPPRVIAGSLRRQQHVHPLLSGLALMALAGIVSLSAYTVGHSAYQALHLQWRQGLLGSSQSPEEMRAQGDINIDEARRILGAAHIDLVRREKTFWLTHDGLPDLALNRFDGECRPPSYSEEAQNWQAFTSPSALTVCMASGWPLTLEGTMREDRKVTLKGQPLPLIGDEAGLDKDFLLWQLYQPTLRQALRHELPESAWRWPGPWEARPFLSPLLGTTLQTLKLPLPPGRPVALLVRDASLLSNVSAPLFDVYVTWTEEQGEVQVPRHFRSGHHPSPQVNILTDLQTWQNAPLNEGAAIIVALGNATNEPVHLMPLRPLE